MMAEGGIFAFSDPDAYTAAFGDVRFNLTITGAGDFTARLSWLRLKNLEAYWCCENLPRIGYISLPSDRVYLSFPVGIVSAISSGLVLRNDDIIFHNGGERVHQRSNARIGVAERTLRVCCAEFLGMSPTRHLLLQRLNRVRTALQRTDPSKATVAVVARNNRFLELGRFAATYHALFGESPSDTLSRAAP